MYIHILSFSYVVLDIRSTTSTLFYKYVLKLFIFDIKLIHFHLYSFETTIYIVIMSSANRTSNFGQIISAETISGHSKYFAKILNN